ncbi:MAG: disulfide bond formation protein B [Gallionellaceae bacterium]|nr:disulfide bond formation protein B [Gallionellaceae bacterium]
MQTRPASSTTTDTGPERAWTPAFLAWLIAAISVLGALFFSEVMKLAPCELCWWQRIFMFPLVLILPLGLFPFDPRVVRYALPLALMGWAFALFHWLLVLGVIPESIRPCVRGVPCSEVTFEWLGFINIPLLSVLAFSAIIALLALTHIKASK